MFVSILLLKFLLDRKYVVKREGGRKRERERGEESKNNLIVECLLFVLVIS
jgi:hypothetical protein